MKLAQIRHFQKFIKTFILAVFVVAGLFLFSGSASAATYYVTQAGGGDGTAEGSPISIAQYNAGTAIPETDGDTIYFLDGFTTGITPPLGGTASAITLRGDYPGRTGSVVVSTGSAINISSKNYISVVNLNGESNDATTGAGLNIQGTVSGITVSGGTYKGAWRIADIRASGTVNIAGSTFYMEKAHFATYNSYGAILAWSLTTGTYSNLTFTSDSDYTLDPTRPTNITDGITLYGSGHTISNISIKRWRLKNNTSNCLYVSAAGSTITNLTMGDPNDSTQGNDGRNVRIDASATLDNVDVYNAENRGIMGYAGAAMTMVVRNSHVEDSGDIGMYFLKAAGGHTFTVDLDDDSAVDVGGTVGFSFDSVSSTTIDNCSYTNFTKKATGFGVSSNTIVNNSTVTGNRTDTDSNGHHGFSASNTTNVIYNNCTAQEVAGDGFTASNGSYTCNYCLSRNNGIDLPGVGHFGDGFTAHEGGDITIRNSVAYGNIKSGVDIQDLLSSGGDNAATYILQNNTFYNNGDGFNEDMGIGFTGDGISSNDTFTIKNNILSNNYGNPIKVRNGATIDTVDWTSDNNLFYETSYTYTWNDVSKTLDEWRAIHASTGNDDANSNEDNPLFVTTGATPNLNLTATSPAIDAGIDLNLSTDYAGNSRYDMPSIANTGSAGSYSITYTDIGSYEYITPPDPTLTSSTHSSESTWYNSKTPVTMAFASPYDTAEKAATTDFIYLINQTASPTAAAVKAGTALDDLATFNAASSITTDGTWYVHAIAQNENETTEYSDNYDTYIIKYDSTAPTGTTLVLGTITTTSITASVSGTTDANAGLHATPYYFDRDSGTATPSWQAGTTWNDTGLTSNAEYSYKVRARDAAVDPNISAYTATQAKYTLAPTPTNLVADTVGQTAITLSVDAINNPTAGSSGYYFTNTTNSTNSGWIQTNTWQDTGLTCGTSYSYTVKYRNGDGTETETATLTQVTANCPVTEEENNTEDLDISDIDYSSTATTITIKWKTNNDADSKVEYGKNTDMNHDKTDSDNEEHHKIILKNLDPDTLYYFKITSEDENGSEDSSGRKLIRTEKADAVSSFVNNLFSPTDNSEESKEETNESEGEEKDIIDQVNEIPEKLQEKLEETKFFNTNVFKKAEQKYLSEVKFKLVDKLSNPIANTLVTLHSDPQTAMTNDQGIVTFQNVETGSHTLAFAYQNENFNKKVAISEPKTEGGEIKAEIVTIKAEQDSIPSWVWGLVGGLVVLLIVVWKFKTKTKQA